MEYQSVNPLIIEDQIGRARLLEIGHPLVRVHLLTEILFSPGALDQIEKISQQLAYLTHIIRGRDYDVMKKFLNGLRDNIK